MADAIGGTNHWDPRPSARRSHDVAKVREWLCWPGDRRHTLTHPRPRGDSRDPDETRNPTSKNKLENPFGVTVRPLLLRLRQNGCTGYAILSKEPTSQPQSL
jgi:hypothetical protein